MGSQLRSWSAYSSSVFNRGMLIFLFNPLSLLALSFFAHAIAMSNAQSRPECQQASALDKAAG